MGSLRGLFRRQTAAPAPKAKRVFPAAPAQEQPLSPEALGELKSAWAELEAAAKETGVNRIQACSRFGGPWQKDPATVRAIAGLIRNPPPSTEL